MGANNLGRQVAMLALAVAFSVSAQATVAKAIPFEDKVLDADSIILGKCTATRTGWDPSGRWIVTYSTFQVDKAYKGAAVPEVTLLTPGGSVGSLHQETIGVPRFETGKQNVLFVKTTDAGPTVLYFDQGAYEVAKDARGELSVQPVASDLVLVNQQSGNVGAAETRRPLAVFEREVGRTLERGERGRIQRYGLVPAREKPSRSASAELLNMARQYRFLIGAVLILIAISTYLLVKGK
jgi:hypothetical protein